ncbi:MAG: hypothetical protein ACKVT0_23160 [Planctomycetaceae bacterium]
MRYQDHRETIQNGDILLFIGKRWWSRVIRRWTVSPYSHVGIAHWIKSDGVERLTVIEALEGVGIVVNPLSQYLKLGETVDWFKITDERVNRDKVVSWAMARWGFPYASWRQIARSFIIHRFLWLKRVYNWLGIPTKIDKDRYFCSWVVAESLKNGGWEPDTDDGVQDPYCVSPGEIALFTCLQRRGRLVWE